MEFIIRRALLISHSKIREIFYPGYKILKKNCNLLFEHSKLYFFVLKPIIRILLNKP